MSYLESFNKCSTCISVRNVTPNYDMRFYYRNSNEVKRLALLRLHSKSFKLYLNVLLYDRNIIGSSSEIFGYLCRYSENVRNVRLVFGQLVKNLRKSSESVRICNFT